jgi:hypothetical protein
MTMRKTFAWVTALAATVLLCGVAHAVTPITYGTLDNFDVINDTSGECHGFEIELEGIAPVDVVYTFGAPYQRYGDPTIVPTATGVIIRYAATWSGSAWSVATPFTAGPWLPTQGHSCWTGGVPDPQMYYSSGCDHFGASLNAVPTKTTYRWLVESAPGAGTLVPYGTPPPLPAPTWTVTPQPSGQPIAAAAIKPPAPGAYEFGDAIWAKVFVTELPEHVHAEDLRHMVIDDPDVDIVPNEPVEVEMEWMLLQASTENEGEQSFGDAAEVGAGNEAVSRRFEFYKYAGDYDSETHEALCDNPDVCPTAVGDLIGTSNAAVNLAGDFAVNSPPVANGDSVSTDEDTALTLAAIDLIGNDTDPDLDPLTIASVQDAVGGSVAMLGGGVIFTPDANFHGSASFTYTVSDGRLGTSTATVSVTVNTVNDAQVADAGPNLNARLPDTVTLDGSGSSDVDGDSLTYSWGLALNPSKSHVALTGADTAHPTFYADKKGSYTFRLTVSDGLVTSPAKYVDVLVRTGK